jgi:acyl-CoA synthetase (NDP forming)
MRELEMKEKNILAELDPLFHPRSVAILGASGKKGKVGRLFMERFVETGFQKLYPVNLRESEILGIKAYPTITDIPGSVDLALVLTPPAAVISTIKECVAKGVKGIIITTAGFGERGEKGKELEREIARVARDGGVRVVGPNCIGIYCPSSRLPFPMGPGKESGPVGVVSQSGSFADHLTVAATINGIRFSKAISCGNECDLTAIDFLEYLGEDPETTMIAAYIEGMKDGRRFYHLARNISKKKPMIVWKCGTTEAGARAAASHTGALAGSGPIWNGVLRQAGVMSVNSLEEMLDCLYALNFQPLPSGRKVGIITGPGGPAVGTTDACLELGLGVPQFCKETKEKLLKVVPPVGTSVDNPVDMSIAAAVAPDIYGDVIRILGQDENIDMLLVIGSGGKQFDNAIIEAMGELRKPLVVAIIIPIELVLQDFRLLQGSSVPVYTDPRRAANALSKLADYVELREGFQSRDLEL